MQLVKSAPTVGLLSPIAALAAVDGVVVVELRGEHDLATAPTLEDVVERTLADGHRLVVDLVRVAFIDSSILAVLMRAKDHARRGGTRVGVVVPRDGSPVRRVLAVTGLDAVLPCFATRASAVASVGSEPSGP